jgi:hypothetical protein
MGKSTGLSLEFPGNNDRLSPLEGIINFIMVQIPMLADGK